MEFYDVGTDQWVCHECAYDIDNDLYRLTFPASANPARAPWYLRLAWAIRRPLARACTWLIELLPADFRNVY
jgi:hypothetical protein